MRDRATHKIIKTLSAAANRAEPDSPERARLTQSVDSAIAAMIERDNRQEAAFEKQDSERVRIWVAIGGLLAFISFFYTVYHILESASP